MKFGAAYATYWTYKSIRGEVFAFAEAEMQKQLEDGRPQMQQHNKVGITIRIKIVFNDQKKYPS